MDVSLVEVGLVVRLSTIEDLASCKHFHEVLLWTACTLLVEEDEALPLNAAWCHPHTTLFSVCETIRVCLF